MTPRDLVARFTQPSLARRLVLSQAALLALLWLCMIAYFIYDVAFIDQWYEPKQMQERADMILSVVDSLADRPDQLETALSRIDEFQRDENRERDDPGVRVTMNVWIGSSLVYRSPGEPGVVEVASLDTLEKSVQNGRRLRTYARQSTQSDARVVLILPGDAGAVFITFWASGIVLLPLLICTPLLLVPAWLSVRFALRPFSEFSAEVADKGMSDLSPLSFRARHSELRPLVNSVNGLLSRLQSSVSRERRFIADAAHELRTPLAAMKINVEALQERSQFDGDKPLLQSLLNSGDRATRLVKQLLSLMRSDAIADAAGKDRVLLDAVVEERLAELAPIAREKSVELELHTGVDEAAVIAQREGLASLIDNLVENAIKYSPRGGTVTVRIDDTPGGIELSIADSGPGIPQQLRERVFERFFRAPDQAQSGSGLGLAIVRSVAEQLGATIVLAEPEHGNGLLVRVRFDRKET